MDELDVTGMGFQIDDVLFGHITQLTAHHPSVLGTHAEEEELLDIGERRRQQMRAQLLQILKGLRRQDG
jgi:hypothetical protein